MPLFQRHNSQTLTQTQPLLLPLLLVLLVFLLVFLLVGLVPLLLLLLLLRTSLPTVGLQALELCDSFVWCTAAAVAVVTAVAASTTAAAGAAVRCIGPVCSICTRVGDRVCCAEDVKGLLQLLFRRCLQQLLPGVALV
jgi:hypothetical protein